MRIDIVWADDWNGIYKNGLLLHEGHNIRVEDLLNCLLHYNVYSFSGPYEIDEFEIDFHWADEQWLIERGRLPNKLEDARLVS